MIFLDLSKSLVITIIITIALVSIFFGLWNRWEIIAKAFTYLIADAGKIIGAG